MTLQRITYPLTILHKPDGATYQKWGGPEGVKAAHAAGATAIDVDAQDCITGEFMATHSAVPGDHDLESPGRPALNKKRVDQMTPAELATFVSTAKDSKGYRIHTLREVMEAAAPLGMTLCVEVKSMGDFAKLARDAEQTGCRVIVMTLPHLGGKNVGYKRLAKAKAAGLPTMVLLNTTRFAAGQVPADQWVHVDYVKGPAKWRKGKPARVVALGAGSKYGITVTPGNARAVTARLRKKWPHQPAPTPVPAPEVPVSRVKNALKHCADQSAHGPKFAVNTCKIQCRTAYGVDSDGSETASIAWGRTDFKHPIPKNLADIPDGALLWWTGGSPSRNHPEGAGHVAIKNPGGVRCWSTDFKRTGFFDLVDVAAIAKTWTKLKLVGWSEDIDGVRVLVAGQPARPPGANTPKRRMDPSAYFLGAVGSHVTWLGRRLVAHGYGRFYQSGPGPTFTATDTKAVAAFQRAQGWSGAGADGLPGAETLKLLAAGPAAAPSPVTPAPFKVKIDLSDISHHQAQNLDLARATKAGLQGLWHKATEGETFKDSRYVGRRGECARAGKPYGAYHFARPDLSKGDGRDEAQFFLAIAKPKPGDLLPCLDLEDRAALVKFKIDQHELTAWVRDFVNEVKRQLGVAPIIYTPFALDDNFGCRLWVARYSNAMKAPVVPKPWKTYDVWQFSNGVVGKPNSLPGFGHVDLNTLNRGVTLEQLRIPATKAA